MPSFACGRCRKEIAPPAPDRCPHCGARLGGVRRTGWTSSMAIVVVLGLFCLPLILLWALLQM